MPAFKPRKFASVCVCVCVCVASFAVVNLNATEKKGDLNNKNKCDGNNNNRNSCWRRRPAPSRTMVSNVRSHLAAGLPGEESAWQSKASPSGLLSAGFAQQSFESIACAWPFAFFEWWEI